MRKDIHPAYYDVEIRATNGVVFRSGSTKNGSLNATFDKYNHSAWLKGDNRKMKTSRVMKYQKKYSQDDFLDLGALIGMESENSEGDTGE